MRFGRRRRQIGPEAPAADDGAPVPDIDERHLAGLFAAPPWLRRLGRQSWLLVGVGLALVGLVWVLDRASTIVLPVVAAAVLAAVASPVVGTLRRRGVPRAAGAALMLLGLLAATVAIAAIVLGAVVAQSADIEATASRALDTISGWLEDAGSTDAGGSADDLSSAVTSAGSTLLKGVAGGIEGLTSLAFFLSFALFSTFFLLKDGPVIRRWVDRHLGIPRPLATLVTGRMLESMRRYFLGVTIVALFNGSVVWLAAVLLGVPAAGAIGVVTVAGAYVPFVGAFVSGAFAVVLTLGAEGNRDALIMLVVTLLANGALQQIVQPLAFGASLDLNPLAVLVLTIGGGSLFGMVGMILAAPIASAAVHVSRDIAAARASVAATLDDAAAAAHGPPPGSSPAGDAPQPSPS